MKTSEKSTPKHPERNSSLELLRIIAMVMIVFSHFPFHGGFDLSSISLTLNRFFLNYSVLGAVGVHIYILLFGYFSYNKARLSFGKIFKLWSSVWFYSVLIFIILVGFGLIKYSRLQFITSFFPFSFSEYWFFTSYIVFSLLAPFINKIFTSLEYKSFVLFLSIMLIIWSVIPTLIGRIPSGGDFSLFFMTYSLGAFVNKYQSHFNIKHGLIMFGISSVVLLISSLIKSLFSNKWVNYSYSFIYSQRSLIFLTMALGLFLIFLFSKPFTSISVNFIASCMFGIYLFHENPIMRQYLWCNVFKNASFAENQFLPAYALLTVVLIFIIGILMEIIKKNTYDKLISILISKFESFVSRLNIRSC